MTTKVAVQQGETGSNGTNNGLQAITLESEPTTIVSVVKTGPKSGKVRVDFAVPAEGLSDSDATAFNQKLRHAGLPLVYSLESNEIIHTRTGMIKGADDCSWWVTPDNARKSKIQGR